MRRLWLIALSLALATGIGHAQQSTQQTVPAPSVPRVDVKTMTPPKPLNNVVAQFSEEALQKNINGRCMVSLIVDARGNPQNARIVRCSDPSFEKSSLDAVAQYRFRPATHDGTAVAVMITIEINYRLTGASDPGTPIRYGFFPPPGATSPSPGTDGVYPLTKGVIPPTMSRFSDEGYGSAAFWSPEKSACDVVLTISAKGKPSDPEVSHCETSSLEKPAVQSLLKSHYKPGSVNGKAVPVRASIHLECGGSPPTK